MRRLLFTIVLGSLTIAVLIPAPVIAAGAWRAPFDTTRSVSPSAGSVLSLNDVLALVSAHNPTLRSLVFQQQASAGLLRQASLWSNPELSAEVEEVGWDAPGLSESEITISLAQEFEFFGQRSARKHAAQAEIDATTWRTRRSAFELYLDTKRRFFSLVHAQQHLVLSATAAELSESIVENIRFKIGKGAALQSELLLAQLEAQRALLTLEVSRQEVRAAQVDLVALWRGEQTEISVRTDAEPDLSTLLSQVDNLESSIDSSRGVLQLEKQSDILMAQQALAIAEARPAVTISSGYKRIEANHSNSLLFGVALPLPLFNRNQGVRESVTMHLRALEHEVERARLEAAASLGAGTIRLKQIIYKHHVLDSLLLPTAEEAYQTLRAAYDAGRVPYTHLLEAERSLNELNFEHSDMLLDIHKQIIALEGLTGVILRTDKER